MRRHWNFKRFFVRVKLPTVFFFGYVKTCSAVYMNIIIPDSHPPGPSMDPTHTSTYYFHPLYSNVSTTWHQAWTHTMKQRTIQPRVRKRETRQQRQQHAKKLVRRRSCYMLLLLLLFVLSWVQVVEASAGRARLKGTVFFSLKDAYDFNE